MPLTVGEWQEILRLRGKLSPLWAIKTTHYEPVLNILTEISSAEGYHFLVTSCPSQVLEPYPPLFELLKHLHQETQIPTSTLLEKSHVYPLHRSLFEGMYEGKIIHRDILFLEELSFESLSLEESLYAQVEILSSTCPTLWVITEAHYLQKKTLAFLRRLMKLKSHHLQIFLITPSLDQQFVFTDFWEELLQDGLAYELDALPSPLKETPRPLSIQEAFSKVRLLLHYFHFSEAIDLLESIRSDMYLTEDEIMYFYLKGMAHYYQREFQQAIESFHNGLEKSFDIANEEQSQHFQFYLALSYLGQGDLEQAYKHIYVVYHHAYSQSIAETFGYLFYYLLITSAYQGRWSSDLESLMQQVLAEADRWGFLNMKAYILGVYFIENMQGGFVTAKSSLLFQVCEEMIKIAETLGNEARLAAAYHNKAMILSHLNKHEEAFAYYRKSLSLKERFQNSLELAQIRNGIAYGYLLAEKYDEAAGFLQQNINAIRTIGSLTEVMLTLVNMAVMLVGTAQYEEAILLFRTLEEMKRIAGIAHLPYHSNEELGCYLGICYAKTHQSLKLFGLYQRVKALMEVNSHSAYEDILWLLFQAYFFFEENRLEECARVLHKWVLLMAEYRPSLWLLWRRGCELFYEVFKEMSPERVSFQGILSRLENQQLLAPELQRLITSLPPLSPVSLFWSREECIALAHEFSTLQSLEQNLVRMHFLRQIYSIMANTSLSSHLFQKILKVIANYLPLSSGFFLLIEDFHWQNAASVNDTHIFDPIFVIEKVYREIPVEQKVVELTSQPYWEKLLPFKGKVYLIPLRRRYTWEGALLLLWNASFSLGREQEDILSMLGEYLAVQVYYKKLLDNLRFLNYDIITGFYKGEEIIQQMRRESARIERYGKKMRNFAIAYIMLENLFHFREKYGENLTNFFLKRFRQHLERSVREVDMVGYMPEGGVIILFPESRSENVQQFVKRMERFFTSPLSELRDVAKLLPKEKTHQSFEIQCHIGIVDYHTCPESPESLVHVAKDMALRARANAVLKEIYTSKRP
ncbi:MAG: tetratricopeptide repeat protein [Brevinematales bacterium]|nr:tetratricopeptide repeat protein [Brevinematales bacterium]